MLGHARRRLEINWLCCFKQELITKIIAGLPVVPVAEY